MNADEKELNPAILEEESSSAYDPFEEARRLDEAYIEEHKAEENPGSETAEQPVDNAEPQSKQEVPETPKEEAKPQGRQLSDEEYENLVRYANLGRDYEAWSTTDEGRSATDFVQKRRNELAAKAKAEAEANPYDAALGSFAEANKKFLGDNPEEYQNAVQGFVREETRKQIQEMLGPQMQELEITRQGRINSELSKMADDYIEYLQDGFGMTADEARNITNKKLGEMVKTTPYNKEAYIRELKGFAGGELLMASKNIAKAKDEEIAQLKQKLAQLQQGIPAQSIPPSTSTAAAAERVLTQSNADYKRGGGIPGGPTGSSGSSGEDEAEEALAYFRGY